MGFALCGRLHHRWMEQRGSEHFLQLGLAVHIGQDGSALDGVVVLVEGKGAGGAVMFLAMGYLLIKNADKTIAADSRLTRPGMWAGFVAGVIVILGNPKAILFYMGMLPGFFDLTAVTTMDIIAIVAVSIAVPFIGNLIFAIFVDRVRRLLSSGRAMRRANITAGCLMIGVGLIIPFA